MHLAKLWEGVEVSGSQGGGAGDIRCVVVDTRCALVHVSMEGMSGDLSTIVVIWSIYCYVDSCCCCHCCRSAVGAASRRAPAGAVRPAAAAQ